MTGVVRAISFAQVFPLLGLIILAGCSEPGPPNGPQAGTQTSIAPLPWREEAGCPTTPNPMAPRPEGISSKCPSANRDLVTVSISGGGTKAAIFGAETLFYLDALGMLPKVSMVSSVSGGSFISALYALSCDRDDKPCLSRPAASGKPQHPRPIWNYGDVLTAVERGFKPVFTDDIKAFLTPGRRSTINASEFGSYIDTAFFGNQPGQSPYTFADLNPRRPRLVLNSTLVSDFRATIDDATGCRSPGCGFERRRNADEFFHFAFTDYYFRQIGSDLGGLPLGFGVASSGAFPAVVDYGVLWDWALCPQGPKSGTGTKNDDVKCQMLALTDGGANDNQGMIEVYTEVAEIVGGQYRTAPPTVPAKAGLSDWAFRSHDRGLLVFVNSSITESTGVNDPTSTDFLFGAIDRSSTAVDVYSAVGYNLRKRLYLRELADLSREWQRQYQSPLQISPLEIGLVTLDRYEEGNAEAALAVEHGMIRDGVSIEAGLPSPAIYSPDLPDFAGRVRDQPPIFDLLMTKRNRAALGLGNIHPQCLYEQAKRMEEGLLSLASLDPANASCLRLAARWATALRAAELCKRELHPEPGAWAPFNDASALTCAPDGTPVLVGDRMTKVGWDAGMRDAAQCVIADDAIIRKNLTISRDLTTRFPKTDLTQQSSAKTCALE